MPDLTAIFVDPQTIVRKSIMCLLRDEIPIKFMADLGGATEGLAAFRRHMPDLVITETNFPDGQGIDFIKAVASSKGKVLVLSSQADGVSVVEGLKAGALAYVLKEDSPDDLVAGIACLVRGETFLSPKLTRATVRFYVNRTPKGSARYEALSLRERDVLRLAAGGRATPAISRDLFLSRRTVEIHRASMMRKLGLRSQTELVRFAIRHGVLPS